METKTKIKKKFLSAAKHSSFFLLLFLIILIALAGYIFHQKIYLFLTPADQNNLLNSQIKQVTVKDDLLEKISENLDKRIFYINKEIEKEFSDPFEP